MAGRKERWGVVDLGSNTVRLCVYEIGGKRSYKRIASAKVAVGLSSYMGLDGVLAEVGICAAGRAVRKLLNMANLMNCQRNFVFATGAARNCANSFAAISRIMQMVDHRIEVISGKDEARLSLRGARETVDMQSGLFFDIGGGSTELMTLKNGTYQKGESIPIGSLSSWSGYVKSIFPEESEIEALQDAVGILIDACGIDLSQSDRVCGIGGTMRLALKVAHRVRPERPNGRMIELDDFDCILSLLSSNPEFLSSMLLQLNPARVHTFLPGCVIAREVLLKSGCNWIVVSKSGLREGYLLQKLEEFA